MDRILARVAAHATNSGDRPAVEDATTALTYRQLAAASDRLAAIIAEHAEPGQVVGYLGVMSVDCVVFNLAAGKAGIIGVALNPALGEADLSEIVAHAGAVSILTTPPLAKMAKSLGRAAVTIFPDWHHGTTATFAPVAAPGDAIQFLTYTSGSTGKPKAVQVTRTMLGARADLLGDAYPLMPDDTCALFNPFWWHVPHWALVAGTKLSCFDFGGGGPRALDTWMREARITVAWAFAAMYRRLIEAANAPFPDLRLLIIGGEQPYVTDIAAFDRLSSPGAEMRLAMASQELGHLMAYAHTHGDPITFDTVPLGRCLAPDHVRLLAEDGAPAAENTPGEITVSGPLVPPGYLGDRERTDAAFSRAADGTWVFHLGDLAYQDWEGVYHGLGRKDQQVKIRGYSVRPPEVEEKLSRHPDVAAAAVTAYTGPRGQTQLAAHVVVSGNPPPDAADLRRFLTARAPAFQIPSHIRITDALPRLPNGKLDRKALPAPPADTDATAFAAASDTEAVLARVWTETLGHNNFGRHDDFFDVGGDSMQAMTMLVDAERVLQRSVPFESLVLQGATIAELAERLDAAASDAGTAQPQILRPGAADRALYAVHVRGGHLSDYLSLLSALTEDRAVWGLHPRGLLRREPPDATMAGLAKHVAAMIAAQEPAEAPVRLLGYSFGALVAMEAARALQAAGRDVSHLILIDPPAFWARRAATLRFAARYLRNERTGTTPSRVLATLAAATVMRTPPDSLEDAHFLAAMRYRPQPLALRNVLYVAADQNPQQVANAAEFTRLLGPSLTVERHPGTHFRVLRPPNHWRLAARLERWLADTG